MLSLSQFSPAELGFPDKFDEFRTEQLEAAETVLNTDKRFAGLCKPTGSGKSVTALLIAKATGLRTVILTSTRGLQEQYVREFAEAGLVDIRGKSNYTCGDKRNLSCRFGPLEGCRLTNNRGCTYECQRDAARASQVVVTNYAYWIRINERGRGLEAAPEVDDDGAQVTNPVELLILDEAHRATEELSRNIQVSIRETWLREARLPAMKSDDLLEWQQYVGEHSESLDIELSAAKATLKQRPTKLARDRVYVIDELLTSFSAVARMNPDAWVMEMKQGTNWGRVWDFDCVWPGAFAESRLFLGVQKVVLMSATLRPVVMQMLGLKKDAYEFREWPRVFPAQNAPIYHLPTVRMNHRIDEEGKRKWLENIDAIIESRQDRKGIIHTVSYERQKYLLANSRFRRLFIANTNDPESESAGAVVEQFKKSVAPSILVSPSFSTGWDFPGRDAEWQIITKLAFPDTRSKVMQARKERSDQYINYLTMQDLVQACGRINRFPADRGETFVVDDSISFFMMQNKHLAPRWFDIRKVSELPPPGPRAPEIE